MQSNNLDVELQRTLNELCSDLFATSALDDSNAILQSLALLAETFPQAQSLLGRLLSRNEDNQARSRCAPVSKLSVLMTNYLYKKETARGAVSLLAALANDNVRNQRRIVENVTGVKLDIDPRKYDLHCSSTQTNLYALTVPATVTSTYRRWRRRQRELQTCHLPSGVPPAQDGIPMPCYCDDCLGAEQFLSTWQQHFHDLSRWSLDPDNETSTRMSPSLSTEEFFRMFLEDYQLRVCSVGEALGNQKEVERSYAERATGPRSLVYYFVSPHDTTAETSRASGQFNPLYHLSAIAIAAEIDVAVVRETHIKQLQLGTTSDESPSPGRVESSPLPTDEVILFTCISDVKSCACRPPESREDNEEYLGRPHPADDSHDRLLADFLKFEDQHGDLAQCDSLVSDVSETNNEVAETTKKLLLQMLAFCESGDQIPLSAFRSSFCGFVDFTQPPDDATTPCQDGETESASLNVKTTMTAKLSEQVLQIDCFETTNSPPSSFSTCIPQQELFGVSSTGDNRGLSLLCLSDEALESLLQRCRICSCDAQEGHADADSVFYLRRSTPEEEEEHVPASNTNDKADETAEVERGELQQCAPVCLPLSGLSTEAERELVKLETVVSEERCRRLNCEGITRIIGKLAKVVADCNERISYLSIARDKKLVRAATQVHREAATSRCRQCRDLLIQLGKKLALKVKPLDPSAPISQEKLSHVAKLIRTSIHDILARSETFDPWETPDARVEKLHLDRRAWASGFPDAAYYQDTDTRRRENRKQQQQLSRKLLLQQQKKRTSKDEARARN
ncbi:hypothetical protein PHYPSEUDO_005143 [Phytophthora pseudosyringae]|uniref:Uncharacterized protein n=1 Tax=Phytophthora pseudosyringae TaxID=221518 RepID=A0A8T1VLM3_9STRA|nr:hypothetical protein PHYPSEUDO_005143 [Phytophthora pseudosyringae]